MDILTQMYYYAQMCHVLLSVASTDSLHLGLNFFVVTIQLSNL